MEISDYISLILTAIGTAVTCFQAGKAKSSAKIAEDAKKEVLSAAENAKKAILERKQIVVFDEILREGQEIDKILSSIESNKASNKGRNISKDYDSINHFVSAINVNKSNIEGENHWKIGSAQNSIIGDLKQLQDVNKNPSEIAFRIHDQVRIIVSIIASEKNNREFK